MLSTSHRINRLCLKTKSIRNRPNTKAYASFVLEFSYFINFYEIGFFFFIFFFLFPVNYIYRHVHLTMKSIFLEFISVYGLYFLLLLIFNEYIDTHILKTIVDLCIQKEHCILLINISKKST